MALNSGTPERSSIVNCLTAGISPFSRFLILCAAIILG